MLAVAAVPASAVVPPNFDDQLVATLPSPTALAFTPDGRMLIAHKDGTLRIRKNGTILSNPALNLSGVTCGDNERGMLGVAVDNSFATNHFIYIFYTFDKFGGCEFNTSTSAVNRVSRFVLGDNDVVQPSSETVLIDNIPSPSATHNGGDLQVGNDDNLYVSVGDGGCDFRGDSGCGLANDAARDLGGLSGKVLRITRSGGIPSGNPFQGTGTARCNVSGSTTTSQKCREIWTTGMRNPFRIAADPNSPSTKIWANDVGGSVWEEIDVLAGGGDYGWHLREGHCAVNSQSNCGPPPLGMTNPIYDYNHSTGCVSITLAAFVPAGIWPEEYDDAYLFGDYVCGKIWRLDPVAGGGFAATEFANFPGGAELIDATFGPDGTGQALYYIDWGGTDELRRISFTGQANRSPTASATANPSSGSAPLTVNFDGSASSDPDNDPLTYEWDFGDGSMNGSGATTAHTYQDAGNYTATLTVRDDRGGEDSTTIPISAGNNPPTASITAPAAGTQFRVGQQFALHGTATDAQDGALPDSALSWKVDRHHDTHTHPFLPPTNGNDVQITSPGPEDLSAATTSHLQIELTATDSGGLSTTVTRPLDPKLVGLTFATNPTGLHLTVAGVQLTGPTSVTSWDNWAFPVNAPAQADTSGQPWELDSWSDGGGAAHTITTPSAPATYTATFRHAAPYARPKGATPQRVSLVPAYAECTGANEMHGPPLAFGSCGPPAQRSSQLTVGTPDANGASAESNGVVRLSVVVGDPASPADESDVQVNVSLTDVRRRSNLADYTGELTLTSVLRITDRGNGASGTEAATTADTPLSLTIPCGGTPGPSTGGTCELTSTIDAVIPGAVREGHRAIWQLNDTELFDGGPDGVASTSPNELFARQGVFIP